MGTVLQIKYIHVHATSKCMCSVDVLVDIMQNKQEQNICLQETFDGMHMPLLCKTELVCHIDLKPRR